MNAASTSDVDLDVDTLLNVINVERRRRLIELAAEHGELSLREASAIIAADEKDIPREDITYEDRHPIYAPLYQNHVPNLAENGVLEVEDNVLRATNVTRDVAELIDVLDGVEIGGARA